MGDESKSGRHQRHFTQWAAQFAVASELCKRGYEVTLTMGNTTPLADLMVVSPKEKIMFLIDVKGLYKKNYWQIKGQSPRENLFYVLAYVPEGKPNQFFVMTQQQVNDSIASELSRARPERRALGAVKLRLGARWKHALEFENHWDILPK
jgi:hypothetical protein